MSTTYDHRTVPLAAKGPVGIPESPYLMAEEAAKYLRFPTLGAYYRWLDYHNVPKCRRGGQRILMFERRVLDDYVHQAEWTKRRIVKRVRARKAVSAELSVAEK